MHILFQTNEQNMTLLQEILGTLHVFEHPNQPNIFQIVIHDTMVDVYLDNQTKMVFHYERFEGKYVFNDFIETSYERTASPYTSETVEKMAKELRSKTKLLKKLKKKWRKAYSLSSLEKILASKKQQRVDSSDFQGWSEFDDEGYGRAVARLEGEVQMLEGLIASKQKKRWLYY